MLLSPTGPPSLSLNLQCMGIQISGTQTQSFINTNAGHNCNKRKTTRFQLQQLTARTKVHTVMDAIPPMNSHTGKLNSHTGKLTLQATQAFAEGN